MLVKAIQVVSIMRQSMLESKLELYKRWGWSKDVVLLAFKRRSHCMLLLEENITEAMDFLVNKMGCPSTVIARNPIIILFNLEKRIVLRCLVIQNNPVSQILSFNLFPPIVCEQLNLKIHNWK